MSRNTLLTLLLLTVAILLAVALFVAGAIWRGRTTSGRVAPMAFLAASTAVIANEPALPARRWRLEVHNSRQLGNALDGSRMAQHEIGMIHSECASAPPTAQVPVYVPSSDIY
jgi:hypothetical protein